MRSNESCQAVLPNTLRVNANLFRQICAGAEDREANPGSMDGFELTIPGTGCPLPGGYDELAQNLINYN